MVSFQCDGCADTVKKPKLDQHRQRCWASFTCLDCSKTFQNQEYKGHTSCISEAEKYQGALYKGAKKAEPKPASSTPISTPAESPAPSSSAGMSIHPSRLNQLEQPTPSYSNYPPRGGAAVRGGGRGGGQGRGRFGQPLVSGENKFAPSGGMRSWGSPADTPLNGSPQNSEPSLPVVNAAVAEPSRKKQKKGDKGGTGSKANSKRSKEESSVPTSASTEAVGQKRKRSPTPTPTAVPETTAQTAVAEPKEISEKTLKRLRKNAGKLGEKTESPLELQEWLKRLGDSKKEQVDVGDVSRAVKVAFEGGKWVLSI